MRRFLKLASLAVSIVIALATRDLFAVAVLTSVGTYDAVTNANVVDSTAAGSSETLAVFAPAVAASFAADLGGVINFDPTADLPADTLFDFRYGTSASKNLRVTTSVLIDPVNSVNPATGSITPISGNGVLTNQTVSPDITFTFGSITDVVGGGVIAGESLTSVGFTLLSRTQYPAGGTNFTVTATFSDATTLVIPSNNIGNAKGTDDTFFSITAPAGLSISSILVDSDATTAAINPTFDDFAFQTTAIPEPSSVLLLSVAGLAFIRLARNRRR